MSQSAITIEDILNIDIPGGRLGYEIIMSDKSKNITMIISNSKHCCETYGVHTPSGISKFIGATYSHIIINGISECEDKIDEHARQIKIEIHTDRGIMEIILYNQHNGYYSHDVYIKTENINCYENL